MIILFRLSFSFLFIFLSTTAFAGNSDRSCFKYLHQIYSEVPSYFKGREIIIKPLIANIPKVVLEHDSEILRTLEAKANRVEGFVSEATFAGFEPAVFKSADVNTVVYPSAGYDAATAFLLFPSAEEVVGIDNHRFWNLNRSVIDADFYSSTNDEKLGWTVVTEVDHREYLAGVILARLSHAFPNLRILSFYEVLDYTMSEDYGNIVLSNGVIEFDTGPNTKVRRYVHLHSPVHNEYEMKPSSWWLDPIRTNGFQAIIRKAGMAFLNYEVGLNLVKELKLMGGILVDGDEKESSFVKAAFEYELSDDRFDTIPIADFGYGHTIRLYRFPVNSNF